MKRRGTFMNEELKSKNTNGPLAIKNNQLQNDISLITHRPLLITRHS